MDHATLFLYLFLLQQQTVGPVVENQQTRIDDALTGGGHIADIVNRLLNTGIGIQVATELDTYALTPAQQLVALEVLRTVKGHVLQEMGQSALVVILLNRTHLLGNVELGTVLRPVVVTDVISQSVVEFTDAYIGVNRNRRHLLCHHHCTTGQSQ